MRVCVWTSVGNRNRVGKKMKGEPSIASVDISMKIEMKYRMRNLLGAFSVDGISSFKRLVLRLKLRRKVLILRLEEAYTVRNGIMPGTMSHPFR